MFRALAIPRVSVDKLTPWVLIGVGLFGIYLFGFDNGHAISGFAGDLALSSEALPGASARAKGMVLAAMAFIAAFLVPFAKYPARPPGVGEPDTVYQREGLYLGLLALSVAGIIVALRAWRGWADR